MRNFEIERFQKIVRRSGVAELLDNELKRGKGGRTGRPSRVSTVDWLAMLMATANDGKTLHSSEVRRTFTTHSELDYELLEELGTRISRSKFPADDLLASESQFETRLRKLGQRLAWLVSASPGISEQEAERREKVLQQFSRALLKASQPNDLPASGAMAVDATAIESYGQFRLDGADSDAEAGHRTPKLSEMKSFFGHSFFVFRRVATDGVRNEIAEPGLTEQLVVRPGNVKGGVGKPILPFILLAAQEEGLKELLADAAWFNTKEEEFLFVLQEAGVQLTIAPKASQESLTSFEGTPMYYGTPLCPGTPDEILEIVRDLKRPIVLSLEANFSEEVLQQLTENPELIPDEFGVPEWTDEGLIVEEEEEAESSEGNPEATTTNLQEQGEEGSAAKDEATLKKERIEEFKKRPYAERRLALAQRKMKTFTKTSEYLSKVEKIVPYICTVKEEASAANDFKARHECPSLTGKLICPRFAPSLDYDTEGRPAPVVPPNCGFCSFMRPADGRDGAVQRGEIKAGEEVPTLSITLPRTVQAKVRSKHVVGTVKWIKSIQCRASIEGLFGTLKSRSGIGLTKGYIAVGGQVQHTILGTIALAVLNYQTTLAWIERGGITNDDVFDPAPPYFGKKEMTGREDQERRRAHFEELKKVA
jgi:hypothetical protein